jgi:internalin A
VIFTFLGRFKVWIELNFEELTISAYIVEDTNAKIEEKTYSKRVQDDIAVYLTKIKNEVAPETQEETDKELDKEKETEECSNTQENEQVQEIPEKISKSDVEQFIFYKIWELYWSFKENDNQFPQLKNDNPTTEEQNKKFYNFIECVPYDMYLSVDNKWFVKYETIHKLEKSQLTEIATNFENCEKTGGYKQKELRLSNFKNYTFNKHIFGMKKILISYSRKDVGYKNLLRDRLSILQKFNIAETWACEDLTDSLWDEKIQKELNDSHLVIFMLSPNFFASEYIVDKEVIPVLKKFSERKQKIMCVKVSEFGAETEINKFFEDKKLNYITSDFQYFPYGTIDDRSTGQVKEQIVPLDQYRQMCGYGSIEPALKQIVDKIIEALK